VADGSQFAAINGQIVVAHEGERQQSTAGHVIVNSRQTAYRDA
jgi:hypothetical protein